MISPKLAKPDCRKSFVKALKESVTSDDDIINSLENAVEEISFIHANNLYNQMQLTALLALEAEFFKFISTDLENNSTETDSKKTKYKDLYDKLFGSSSKFVEKYKQYSKALKTSNKDSQQVNNNFIINYQDVNSIVIEDDPSDSRAFKHKLEFVKNIKPLWVFNDTNNNPKLHLSNANAESIEAFLMDIDPHLMSYAIVLNNDNFTIEYSSTTAFADIFHEIIAATYVIFFTLVDLTMVSIPPAAVAALAITYGATLPITIGAAICVLYLELSYKEITENYKLRTIANTAADNVIANGSTEISNQQITPFQIFDFSKLVYQISTYTLESYQKHQDTYLEKSSEDESKSLQHLLNNRFKNRDKMSKRPPRAKKLLNREKEMLHKHLADMGYNIKEAHKSQPFT